MRTLILGATKRTTARLHRFKPHYVYIIAPAQFSGGINGNDLSRLNLEMLCLQTAIYLLTFILAVAFFQRGDVLKYTRRNRRIVDFHTATSFLRNSNLASRANANRHLRDAFGIVNPFVIGESSFRDQFVKCVHRQLHRVTSNWSEIIDSAKAAVERTTAMSNLDHIRNRVRVIVMSIALKIIDVGGYSTDELPRVGELIDLIWLQAKTGAPTRTLRNELHAILRRWEKNDFIDTLMSISNVDKERAILSILIPAYETMYRVVLPLIFHTHNKISFDRFLDPNVSEATLIAQCEEDYTYLALIQETLRRYPVVKRIKRATLREMTSVDIAAMHLEEEMWDRPYEFDPVRWANSRKEGGYMPFGAGKGRCIANEKIVGMIVGIVLGVMEKPLGHFRTQDLRGLLVNDRGKQGPESLR